MRLLVTIRAAALSFAALSGAAGAADLPRKAYPKAPPLAAVYDWSGVYIGLNAGGASSDKCWTIFSERNLPFGPVSEGCHDATGVLLGGQAGYRWQFSNWVLGVELQGDWAHLKGSNANQAVRIPATNETRIDAIGMVTGQVGYAWNNILWYAKGGVAAVSDKYSTFFTANNIVYNEARETRWGAVVGTGIEFGFVPNWSVALEYDHLFMGTKDVTFPQNAIAVTRSDSIRQDVDMGTIRVNYRFGGPVVAKY